MSAFWSHFLLYVLLLLAVFEEKIIGFSSSGFTILYHCPFEDKFKIVFFISSCLFATVPACLYVLCHCCMPLTLIYMCIVALK